MRKLFIFVKSRDLFEEVVIDQNEWLNIWSIWLIWHDWHDMTEDMIWWMMIERYSFGR